MITKMVYSLEGIWNSEFAWISLYFENDLILLFLGKIFAVVATVAHQIRGISPILEKILISDSSLNNVICKKSA